MKYYKVIILGALLAIPIAVGCGNSKLKPTADGGGGSGGRVGSGSGGAGGGAAGSDGGAPEGPLEFTDFVNDLIKTKTAENNRPETIDDKTFKDSMNPAAFDPLFQ